MAQMSTDKAAREPSRVRIQGTIVTNPALEPDPGMARINAIRAIVTEKQYAKVDGVMLDLFTASLIIQIYDAISAENQAKYRNMHTRKMADIAYKLAK